MPTTNRRDEEEKNLGTSDLYYNSVIVISKSQSGYLDPDISVYKSDNPTCITGLKYSRFSIQSML